MPGDRPRNRPEGMQQQGYCLLVVIAGRGEQTPFHERGAEWGGDEHARDLAGPTRENRGGSPLRRLRRGATLDGVVPVAASLPAPLRGLAAIRLREAVRRLPSLRVTRGARR